LHAEGVAGHGDGRALGAAEVVGRDAAARAAHADAVEAGLEVVGVHAAAGAADVHPRRGLGGDGLTLAVEPVVVDGPAGDLTDVDAVRAVLELVAGDAAARDVP